MKNKIITTLVFIFLFTFALASCEFGDKTHTVKFDALNGSEVKTVKVIDGNGVEKPADPEKEGFIFEGWFLDLNSEEEYKFTTPVNDDLVLYAKWLDSSTTYTVTFETNGGTNVEPKVLRVGAALGEVAEPQKTCVKFAGWFLDEELTKAVDETFKVTEDTVLYASYETVYVLGISQNESYAQYLRNIKEQPNKYTEFTIRDVNYTVGNNNAWKLLPQIELGTYDADNDEFNEVEVGWKYALALKLNGEAVENSLYVSSFDEEKGEVVFNSAALGKTFEVIVTPLGLTDRQLERIDEYTIKYTVDVIDGYNVYDALELAYMENRTTDYNGSCGSIQLLNNEFWTAFKTEHNLELNYNPKALILHENLVVTKDTIPAQYFYSDEILSKADSDYDRTIGSLIDNSEIFFRVVAAGDKFQLLGNYFNIDCSAIREVQREWNEIKPEGSVISHTTLMRFEGEGTVEVANLSITGNAPRVENTIKGGGIIFTKVMGPDTLFDNMLCFDFFITFMPNRHNKPMVIDHVKVVNAYNSFLYNWGSEQLIVKNSEFSSCGGPVMIQDCVDFGKEDEAVGRSKFINCKFDSFVTGQESWFVSFNATALVGQIKAIDQVFNAYGKSFLKTDKDGNTYMNLIVLNKSGEAQGITNSKISGSTQFDETTALDFGESNPYFAALLEAGMSAGAPVFLGINADVTTGFALFNGEYLIDVQQQPITDPTNPLFTSQYFAMYYGGMCMIFELFNVGEVYQG